MKNTAGKFILKNFVKMVLLIFAVSIAAFALMTVSPVDPLQANVGQAALGSMSQEQIAKLEEYWGVGEPPVQRYLAWLKDFLKGDMGVSLLYRQDVAKVIAVKLGNSLFLMIIAWVLSGLIGFALGALAGMNRGKFVVGSKRLLSVNIKYSGFLDRHAASDRLRGVAEDPSHRAKRTHRRGGKRRDFSGQGISCHSSGGYAVHYRNCQYCHAYQRKK